MSGASFCIERKPIPRTRIKSRVRRKPPSLSRKATMAAARLVPIPGSFSKSAAVPTLISSRPSSVHAPFAERDFGQPLEAGLADTAASIDGVGAVSRTATRRWDGTGKCAIAPDPRWAKAANTQPHMAPFNNNGIHTQRATARPQRNNRNSMSFAIAKRMPLHEPRNHSR